MSLLPLNTGMRLTELLRPTPLIEARPKPSPPPQEAYPRAIQDCLTRVERLTTSNPKVRAALDEAKRALTLAKDISEDDFRRLPALRR